MRPDLETLISRRFEEMADTPMFPHDVQPDDFELIAALEWLGDVRGSLIYDVGCGKGRFVKALSALGARVIGADPTWKMVSGASKSAPGFSFVQSSATRLPFVDASCDGLVCVEVIEHIPDIEQAIAEISRVLKPGGRAILIDKNPVGIGYQRLYPNWVYKTVMERLGRWLYPRGFPFRERWHSSWGLRRRLRPHFKRVEFRYLDGRVKGRRRRLLAPLFGLFPFLRPDVAWCCQR